jgi:hypothetical protein
LAKLPGTGPMRSTRTTTAAEPLLPVHLDHKVVGVQYLAAMLVYFFVAGLFALVIRSELLSPTRHLLAPETYVEVVGEHGTMMMMMMTSAILGPFGNYLIPLMIGARRMAFPRLEALSFWLTPAGVRHPAVRADRRRVPDRLDRLRAAVRPGQDRAGRLPGRFGADGDCR